MVRESHPEDIPQITAICNHYIESSTAVFDEQPMSEAQMLRRYEEVAMHGLPFLVDWHDGEVTGYCYAHPWKEKSAYGGTLEITIYLSPAFLGRGIGSRLLGQTIEACRRHGAHALIACITGGNVASERLFLGHGFERVSCFKEVGHKFGRWLDVVDYELIL